MVVCRCDPVMDRGNAILSYFFLNCMNQMLTTRKSFSTGKTSGWRTLGGTWSARTHCSFKQTSKPLGSEIQGARKHRSWPGIPADSAHPELQLQNCSSLSNSDLQSLVLGCYCSASLGLKATSQLLCVHF